MATATTAISLGSSVSTLAHKNAIGATAIAVGVRVTCVPLASSDEISGRGPSNLKSWLPPQQTPLAYVEINGTRHPILMDARTWYLFFQYVADIKLGGINGPTLANVATDVVAAKTQASEAVTSQVAVTQQVQANAQALQAAVEVAQNAGLSGSDQIPPVSRTPTMIP